MRVAVAIAVLALAVTAGTTAGARWMSSFLGAPAGTPLAFTLVPLPPVAASVAATPRPGLDRLLHGNTVITSEVRMRRVWRRLFDVAYDPSLFDFQSDFVVLMGGGALAHGSFDVTAVERVDAAYEDSLLPDGPVAIDPFLCITATTVLPGRPPPPEAPATYRLSAARISRVSLDDVVYHRALIPLP